MNPKESAQLAQELHELVSRVPGVVTVYPASLTAALIATGDRIRGVNGGPPVAVGQKHGHVTVNLAIGVSRSSGAGATCRAVHDAVADRLRAYGHDGSIVVTVAQVTETAS